MAEHIRNGTATAVSDGSYSPGHSTSGFILTRRNRRGPRFHDIRGSNIVPGIPEEQDSYRAELGGAMGALTALELVCSVYNITQGSAECGFDGLAAMEKVSADKDPSVEDKAYDIIMAVRNKAESLPIQITWRHTEGHQDDNAMFHQLDRWAQLNVQADGIAKNLLRKINQGTSTLPWPGMLSHE
jgi:hypothetical protein